MASRLLWVIPVLTLAIVSDGVRAVDDGNRGEIQAGPKADPSAVDAEAPTVAALEARGAIVIRDEQRPGRPVVRVALCVESGKRVSLPSLAALQQLEVLSLHGTSIGDAGLKSLYRLEHLTTLYIEDDGAVTEEGLTALQKACPQISLYREVPRQTGIIREPALAP
jgi:hypothetical protein